jgi:hypothetical protein
MRVAELDGPHLEVSEPLLPEIIARSVLALSMAQPAPPAADPRPDPDQGALGSVRLQIPEPMVFDLVRPLGAQKGEIEVNSLFLRPLTGRGRALRWAPEVEMTYAEGHAIEFELPAEGAEIESYKLALQSKFPARKSPYFTHGWQGIAEKGRHGFAWDTSQLYLTGVRWHPRWSMMSLNGARYARPRGAPGRWSALANNTLFYQAPRRPVLGLESNLELSRKRGTYALLMPQMHVHIGSRFQLQFGAGGERRPGGAVNAAAAWRLIREF